MILAAFLLSGVTVVLPMEAEVKGTELRLGSIADVRGDDADLVGRVEAFGLGYAPSPGFSRLLHAHRVQADLERAFPGLAIRIEGQPACRVRPEVLEIEAELVRAAVEAELAHAFAGADAVYAPREALPSIVVPAGNAPPRLKARVETAIGSDGVLSVPVDVLVDGAPYRTVWTTWTAERWEVLPVLVRAVQNGERIQPHLIESRRVRALDGRAKALPASMLLGAVAARDLAAGTPVTSLDVHRPAVIGLGDDVLLEVKRGKVTARVAATSLSTAAIGDRLRVRSIANGHEHTGVVVSRDLVRIDLGG